MGLFGLVKQYCALILLSMLLLSTALTSDEVQAAESATTAAVTTATPVTESTATDSNQQQSNATKEPVATVPATAISPVSKSAEQPRANALPGVGQIVISLALVVGLVLLLAFFYKKMQLKLPGNKHFRIVATLNIGQRERLLVIEMQGKQRVLGVTAQQINFLFDLETPLPEEKLASDFHTQLQSFLKK
jgi:flagellar protein FliO/FliZ